jgi:hypothetical protein
MKRFFVLLAISLATILACYFVNHLISNHREASAWENAWSKMPRNFRREASQLAAVLNAYGVYPNPEGLQIDVRDKEIRELIEDSNGFRVREDGGLDFRNDKTFIVLTAPQGVILYGGGGHCKVLSEIWETPTDNLIFFFPRS